MLLPRRRLLLSELFGENGVLLLCRDRLQSLSRWVGQRSLIAAGCDRFHSGPDAILLGGGTGFRVQMVSGSNDVR
jgi:hypothetical protein